MSGKDIKEARRQAGISQQKMSDLLGIPKRTIESREAEERTCFVFFFLFTTVFLLSRSVQSQKKSAP
jgi:transcriptional regulator with XRE-family HTH domain